MRRCLFVFLALVLLLPATFSALAQPAGPPDRVHQDLISEASRKGHVPVIIRLDTDNAESRHKSWDSRPSHPPSDKKDRIRHVSQSLIERMDSRQLANIKQYRNVPFMAGAVDAETLQELLADPAVIRVYPDLLLKPLLENSTEHIGALNIHSHETGGATGQGTVIAILDTGMDPDHEFYKDRIVQQACFSMTYSNDELSSVSLCPDGDNPGGVDTQIGGNAGKDCDTSISGCGHGTHVGGIAAGSSAGRKGVAPEAGILSIQVFSYFDEDNEVSSWLSDQMRAFDWILDIAGTTNIVAANLSLGSAESHSGFCDDLFEPYTDIVNVLKANNIATVFSAGNSGKTGGIGFPSCISSAISVGATRILQNETPPDQLAEFSNNAIILDLLAPGQWIASSVAGGGYGIMSGTSMAAPHVTGAWALVRQAWPDATVDEVLQRLVSTGVPVADHRNESGLVKPRIQVDEAVLADPGDVLPLIALPATGVEATLASGSTSSDPFQISNTGTGTLFWQARIHDETADWLAIHPLSGAVAEGGHQNITFDYDTDGLEPGTYDTQLIITSNDTGGNPEVIIPVSLTVLETPLFTRELHGNEGFRLLSVPAATTFGEFLDPVWTQGLDSEESGGNTTGGDPNVFVWDHAGSGGDASGWQALTDLTGNIAPGTGLLVYVFKDDEPGVDGSFPKTLSVAGEEFPAGTSVDVNENAGGWLLLGNPFAVPVDFTELEKTNLSDVVYVWDPNDGSGTVNPGEEDPGAGSWQSFSEGAGTGDLSGGIIAAFQGFFVQNDAGGDAGVTFNVAARTQGGTFMGKQATRQVVRLELSGQGLRNSAWMSFRDNGAFEKTYGDAWQLMPLSTDYAMLAVNKAGELFDISVLPEPGADFELPLHVEATRGGTFSLSVTDWEISFDQTLYLVDRWNDFAVALGEGMAYEFELDQPLQKAVRNPFELIANGPLKAAVSEEPRFVITTSALVSTGPTTDLPDRLELAQNYPNPFNPATVISYALPEQAHVTLTVYDMLGRQVGVLVDQNREPGSYQVSFDASALSSGVYLYRLESAGQTLTRKMTLVK